LFDFIEVVVEDEIVDTCDYQTEEEVGYDIGKEISYDPYSENTVL
jgi:hypothetical protein